MFWKKKYKAKDIFVPGGQPSFTYNPRNERKLEAKIKNAAFEIKKLVMVTGMTKSGKSVLTKTVLKKSNSIWCDCGSFDDEQSLWDFILYKLDAFNSVSKTDSKSTSSEYSLKTRISFWISSFFEGNGKRNKQKQKSIQRTRNSSSKIIAIDSLKEQEIPLVLDDFHYIKRGLQGNIVRALKAPIFNGLPVIFIAIPHRRLDAVKVEREMTGRVETIQIPIWDKEELIKIANAGFPLLNIKIDDKIISRFAMESYGSPHLMQEFCLEFCESNDISQTKRSSLSIKYNEAEVEEIFKSVATNTGKVVYDKLAKGPRQRSDRIKRPLKKGGEVDIYEATLLSLVHMKPGLSTIQYEELREAMRNILSDKIPNSQEISRVLSKMSELALDDESSTPVIDWEKEEGKLHITDPFFAFYLKWGVL